MSDDDIKEILNKFPVNELPPDAMGAAVYVDGVHVGYLVNPAYEKLIRLRAKIKTGEVNEDGDQGN